MQENIELISGKIAEAEMVLVGIGEKFDSQKGTSDVREAYEKLLKCLTGKNYFMITVCDDELLYETGFREDRIVRPLAEEESGAQGEKEGCVQCAHLPRWETYMKWLQGTLHRRLLVLELGVGLRYPQVIRFPFEKIVYLNQQAEFIRVHDKLFQLPEQISGRAISISSDVVRLFADAEI